MTKSESTTASDPGTVKTYAGLRFSGDRLEPAMLTALLGAMPQTAYRKGEVFKVARGQPIRGRTGLWLLSSDGKVDSRDLNDHFAYLLDIVFPDESGKTLVRLHRLMHEFDIGADVTCFWHGRPGAPAPAIREDIRARFAQLPAAIETDFDTD